MQIKKGQQFKCIKTVVMYDEEQTVAYIEGQTYISDHDRCITDRTGDTCHEWIDEDNNNDNYWKDYFEPIEATKSYSDIQELDVSIAKCKMELWDLMQKYGFKSTLTAQILIGEGHQLLCGVNQPMRDKLIQNND